MSDAIKRILLVEDDDQYAEMLSFQLEGADYEVHREPGARKALAALEGASFDLILTDILMPGMSGIDFLEQLALLRETTPVIVMSAYGSIDTAIQAMKKGAYDYVAKPFKKDELLLCIRKLEERESLRKTVLQLQQKIEAQQTFGGLIGGSPAMLDVYSLIKKVSPFKSTVLVLGQSGTGKELVARAIHSNSPRSSAPFVALNCAAIPETLLESEIFGHVRGAFTDAHADRKGLFEEANGGTLLLDEIGELPLALQAKLLRTLQDSEVRRVGGTKSLKVDVRVLAATARDLKEEVAAKRFREDLFYRLNVVQIVMPPLRNRLGDIELLVGHFISKTNKRLGTSISGIDESALRALQAYSWPGNVRELENAVERAAVLAEGSEIRKENLPAPIQGARASTVTPLKPEELSIKKSTRELEARLIRAALLKTGGNRTRAAEILEISHRALLYKLREYNIDVPPQ